MDSKNKTKTKRERSHNWDSTEKEMLRQFVEEHFDVIENRGNDTKMIRRKKAAWESISTSMRAAGYQRSVDKLKQQWVRMKMFAKKSAPVNRVTMSVVDASDVLVQSMTADDLEDDNIPIHSNTTIDISSTHSDTNSSALKSPASQSSKLDVMAARQAKIEEERSHAAELHLLELEHRKQLYSLQIKLLEDRIAHQRELHEVLMDKRKRM